jgi:hypothetical protein
MIAIIFDYFRYADRLPEPPLILLKPCLRRALEAIFRPLAFIAFATPPLPLPAERCLRRLLKDARHD